MAKIDYFKVPQRSIDKIIVSTTADPVSGCWIWTGRVDRDGYGRFAYGENGQVFEGVVHRAVYVAFHGAISCELTVDHMCHVAEVCWLEIASDCPHRRCVNPAHLQAATARDNTLRGNAFSGVNARRTHCAQGHKFTPENTYVPPTRNIRMCRKCLRATVRRQQLDREKTNAYKRAWRARRRAEGLVAS